MTALRNWLIANGHETTDAETVIAALSETVELSRDHSRWYPTGIGSLIGREALITLIAGLESTPQMKPMVYVLTAGVFLDDADTRATIQELQAGGLLSEASATALLDAGIQYGTEWQKAGLSVLPFVAEIEAAQALIATEELREEIARRYRAVREAVDAGDVLSVEAAVAKFGEN